MNKNYHSYRYRAALTDMIDWASANVRRELPQETWGKIVRLNGQIKGLLDDCHAQRKVSKKTPDDILDELGTNSYLYRAALTDMIDWASVNVRRELPHKTWGMIVRLNGQIKGLLDDCHAQRKISKKTPDDILDELGA